MPGIYNVSPFIEIDSFHLFSAETLFLDHRI